MVSRSAAGPQVAQSRNSLAWPYLSSKDRFIRNAAGISIYSLQRFPLASLTEDQLLQALRVLELSFARQGKPVAPMARQMIALLDPLYPATSESVNRELVQLPVYLEAPDLVAKTLALVDRAKTQEEQIHYILCLRTLKSGWTLDQYQNYTARTGLF